MWLIGWWLRDPRIHWKGGQSTQYQNEDYHINWCLLIPKRSSLIAAPTAMRIKHSGTDRHARQPKNVHCLWSSPRCGTETWLLSYSCLNKLSFLLHISDLPQLWCVIIISCDSGLHSHLPTLYYLSAWSCWCHATCCVLCDLHCHRSEPIAVITGTTTLRACPCLPNSS